MKKIYSILIILSACITISCNDSSSGGLPNEYIDPRLILRTDLSSDKSYADIANECEDCPRTTPDVKEGKDCKAVIYQGTLNNTPYVGIAVDDDLDFKLKIYWTGSIDTPTSEYTIKIIHDNSVYTSTTSTLDITINQHTTAAGIYEIKINTPITIPRFSGSGGPASITIQNTTIIHAYKY